MIIIEIIIFFLKFSEYLRSVCNLLGIDDCIDFKNQGTSPDLLSYQVDIENAFEKIKLSIKVSFYFYRIDFFLYYVNVIFFNVF
jgi:hypothetical protein